MGTTTQVIQGVQRVPPEPTGTRTGSEFDVHLSGKIDAILSMLEDERDPALKAVPEARLHELEEAGPSHVDQATVAALLDEVRRFIRTYVVLNEDQLVAISLWVVHTHTFSAADATPYLHICSPEKRTGKSRLIEVLELLVARACSTAYATPAALRRKVSADAPTLLLDEIDAAFKSSGECAETLRGFLNSGWRRGGKATVCAKRDGDWRDQDFGTFCPKALAGIGRLPDTVEDRAICIEMKRRKDGESVSRLLSREGTQGSAPLRGELVRKCAVLVRDLAGARPDIPRELDDRAADIWEPLLAIADAAGDEWSGRARVAALALSAGRAREDASIGVRLLADTREVFGKHSCDRLASATLAKALSSIEEAPWGDWHGRPLDARGLSRLLRPYEVKPKTIRLGNLTPKGYEKTDFADAWSRYLDVAAETDARGGSSATRNTGATGESDQDSLVAGVADVSVSAVCSSG